MRKRQVTSLLCGLGVMASSVYYAPFAHAAKKRDVLLEPWVGQRVVMLLPLQIGPGWNADQALGRALLPAAEEELQRALAGTGKLSVLQLNRFNPIFERLLQERLRAVSGTSRGPAMSPLTAPVPTTAVVPVPPNTANPTTTLTTPPAVTGPSGPTGVPPVGGTTAPAGAGAAPGVAGGAAGGPATGTSTGVVGGGTPVSPVGGAPGFSPVGEGMVSGSGVPIAPPPSTPAASAITAEFNALFDPNSPTPALDRARTLMSQLTFDQPPLIGEFTLEEVRASGDARRPSVQVQVSGRLYELTNQVANKTVVITSDPMRSSGRDPIQPLLQAAHNAFMQVAQEFVRPIVNLELPRVAPVTTNGAGRGNTSGRGSGQGSMQGSTAPPVVMVPSMTFPKPAQPVPPTLPNGQPLPGDVPIAGASTRGSTAPGTAPAPAPVSPRPAE